jgi:hypothetical protein
MSDRFGNIPIQPPVSKPRKPSSRKQHQSARKKATKTARFNFKSGGWLLLLPVVFIIYSLIGFFAVPYYITDILPATLFENTGILFKTENPRFNPYTFTFRSENISLQLNKGDKRQLLSIKLISGNLSPVHLLRNDFVCNDLTIINPIANIVRNADRSYNFSPLFKTGRQKSYSEMMNFSDLPFHFSLNNIRLSDGNVTFIDLPAKKSHSIKNIQLALPSFSNVAFQADNYIRPHFSATINGSPIELSGEAGIGETGNMQTATDLVCNIKAIDLPQYLSYLPFSLPFTITQGKTDGKIGLKFNPKGEKGRKLAVQFTLNISKANFRSHAEGLDLAVPRARLEGTLYPVDKRIHLKTVSLTQPVISSSGGNLPENIRSLVNIKKRKQLPGQKEKTGYTTLIDTVTMKDGILKQFAEKKEKSRSTWSSLQLEIHHFSTINDKKNNNKEQNNSTFILSGTQKGSSASFAWKGKIIHSTRFEGTLTVSHIKLKDLSRMLDLTPLYSATGTSSLKGNLTVNFEKNKKTNSFFYLNNTFISVQNFHLHPAEKKPSPELAAEKLTFTGFSWHRDSIDFGKIQFKKGDLKLQKGKIPTIFSSFTSGKYQIHSLQFNGRAKFAADKSSQIHFPEFSIVASELNHKKPAKNNISISAGGKEGILLKSSGSVQLKPFKSILKTEFYKIPAKSLFPWFSSSPFLAAVQGRISGKGTLSFPQTGYTGKLVADGGTVSPPGGPTVSWEKTVLHGMNYSLRPFHLGIALVELQSPSFSWTITSRDDSALENIAFFLKKNLPMADREHRGKNTVTLSPVDIQEIVLMNARIALEDTRISPPWSADITDLKGHINNIHSGMTPVISQMQCSGKIDDSFFTAEAQSDLFSHENNGSFNFTLDNIPLASFHRQLSPLLDINSGKGNFDLEINSYWEDGQLSSSGKIRFFGIEPVSLDAESALPLALLENTNNSFSMDLSFSRPHPAAASSLFERLLINFQKYMVKASVSPFLLTRGDFTELIDNESIEFIPGEFMLSDKGRKNLSLYGALLINHPSIRLVLSGDYNEKTDKLAMGKQLEKIEKKRIDTENREKFKEWKKQKDAYDRALELKQKKLALEGKIIEQDIPPKFLQEFIPLQPQKIQVDQAMLKELARKRAEIVLQHLSGQLQLKPERIILQEKKDYGAVNGVSISLTPYFQTL